MKEQEELLRAVWFTDAEVNGGQEGPERLGSGNRLEKENGWSPISGTGLVWLEDNLKGTEVNRGPEENDAEILSFPPKMLDGWQPLQRKENAQRNVILDHDLKEKYEGKVVTLKPQIVFHDISPEVPASASKGWKRRNMRRTWRK